MHSKTLEALIENKELKKRMPDGIRTETLLHSSALIASFALKLKIDEESAIAIFTQLYGAVRQLGDAKWWMLGYESRSHHATMELLKEVEDNPLFTAKIERFKEIRNDATYRGYLITAGQAQEIVEFWKKYGDKIIKWVREN